MLQHCKELGLGLSRPLELPSTSLGGRHRVPSQGQAGMERVKMLWRCLSSFCPRRHLGQKEQGATSDFLLRALGLGAHHPLGAKFWSASILPSLETGKQRKEKCKSSQGDFLFFFP